MQYKIPQNVGIEDKIVGPLTLRQLIFLAVGFGISYVLFAILSKAYELNILEYIVIAIPALVASALALIRINDITLTRFIFLFLEFAIKPKRRLWNHRGISSTVSPDLSSGKVVSATTTTDEPLEKKSKKATNLSDLSRILDSGGFDHLEKTKHEDIDEVRDDNLVTHSYFGHKTNETENMYWRTTDAHKEMLKHFSKLSTTKLKKGTKEAAIAQEEISKVKAEVEQSKTAPTAEKEKIQKKPPAPQDKSTKPTQSSGEFKFEELKKGEIEINLD